MNEQSTTPLTKRFSRERLLGSIYNKSMPSPDGCWNWIRTVNSKGYGQIWDGVKSASAHRVSFEIHKGNPAGRLVCHSCDNPRCVNPDHLFAGSYTDNINDSYIKQRRGKINGRRRAKMIKMIKSGASDKRIAVEFNVVKSAIYYWRNKLGL